MIMMLLLLVGTKYSVDVGNRHSHQFHGMEHQLYVVGRLFDRPLQ